MRSVVLVAYDVTDDGKRSKVHSKLKGYGDAIQYSLFLCVLTANQRVKMRSDLWGLIDHSTDRILLVDLGPDDGRGRSALESWGRSLDDPASHDGIMIV